MDNADVVGELKEPQPSGRQPGLIQVVVAYSPAPRAIDSVAVELPLGATLQDALVASGLPARHGFDPSGLPACGVWAKLKPLDHPLREGDRVEVYRPLRVDPKEARRQRYKGKGSAKSR